MKQVIVVFLRPWELRAAATDKTMRRLLTMQTAFTRGVS
jgi:hypothetical protein